MNNREMISILDEVMFNQCKISGSAFQISRILNNVLLTSCDRRNISQLLVEIGKAVSLNADLMAEARNKLKAEDK